MISLSLPPLIPFLARSARRPSLSSANPLDDDSVGQGLPLRLDGIGKRFGERQVLRDLSLDIPAGQFVAVVGRSGCGKSTLLRLLAGLDDPSAGRLRGVAMRGDVRIMYQDSRLLPWRSVLDNVALGLDGPRKHVLAAARDALSHVGLADRAGEWPGVLSGGQRQRVALARALVHRPRLLLLDEPLGALDALTRIEMHALIERIWREEGFTALLVTHDVTEAVVLADRVVLIEEGAVVLDEEVALPRPRDRADPEFVRLENQILSRVLG